MNFIKNSKGITLIALVITIIVLLILAGVSLNLIMGNQGILNQATKAVEKNKAGSIQEEIQLAIAEKTIEYYKNYSETSKTYKTENDYIKGELSKSGGITTSSGATITADNDGNLSYKNANGVVEATGTYDENGNVTLDTENAEKELPIVNLADTITTADYGKKVDYSVSSNGVTLNDWKIFYNDGTNVYLIISDYLPVNAIQKNFTMASYTSTNGDGYSIYWINSDQPFLEYLSTSEYWDYLVDGLDGATAVGGFRYKMMEQLLTLQDVPEDLIKPSASLAYWACDDNGWHAGEPAYLGCSENGAYLDVTYDIFKSEDARALRPIITLPTSMKGTVGDTVKLSK